MKIYEGYEKPVEVSDELYKVLSELDKQWQNNEKRHHRNDHKLFGYRVSLEEYTEHGAQIPERDEPLEHLFAEEEFVHIWDILNHEQRALLQAIYFDKMSISAYARKLGISQAAVSQRLAVIRKKLCKYFMNAL
jgi:RNA polymerase sigma factor (sigma-70 family)